MAGLSPTTGIWLVTTSGIKWLDADEITTQSVGAKAFGLTTIPQNWTLPFYVIGSDLFDLIKDNPKHIDRALTQSFLKLLSTAAEKTNLRLDEAVYLRSSAVSENIEERGKFHSKQGPLANIADIIRSCCLELVRDHEAAGSTIFFVVQKLANPIRFRGHLSNTRRLVEEGRDWVYELEDVIDGRLEGGRIPIRPWREGEFRQPAPLKCQFDLLIPDILRIPARWAWSQSTRVHFEWVWDGNQVFIVQSDMVFPVLGTDPTKITANLVAANTKTNLIVFRKVKSEDGHRFSKVKNVLTYRVLRIPTPDLFILDDRAVLNDLAKGTVSAELSRDLESLSQRSLVLRTDLQTDDLGQKQMLPRSDEVRTLADAKNHLLKTLKTIASSGADLSKVAILAHHFIPAVTSAWVYAEPRSRKVLIETLWGIPEGLYYYAHDTFEVDTLRLDPTKIVGNDEGKFRIRPKLRYKRHFVMPTPSGVWKTHTVAEPYDWRPAIRQKKWICQIARQSRLIAALEEHAVNVMWFIDLPKATNLPKVTPWYHEKSIQRPQFRKSSLRKKMVTDHEHFIETISDITGLQDAFQSGHGGIRRIRIRPKDDTLLRDKNFATEIGELAKKIGAVILLEGGILSHTYYILCRTGAQVETLDSFIGDDEYREFNKLVRDRIPEHIAGMGEKVSVTRLQGDQLVRELRIKLVEEAIEALDATGYDALQEELADVLEVISSLGARLGVRRGALDKKKRQKKLAKGGFSQGFVLLETQNPSITTDSEHDLEEDLLGDLHDSSVKITELHTPPRAPSILLRSIDRRQVGESTEGLLTIVVPLLADKWETTSGEISIVDKSGRKLGLRVRLTGRRIGSTLRFELSTMISPEQFELELPLHNTPKRSHKK